MPSRPLPRRPSTRWTLPPTATRIATPHRVAPIAVLLLLASLLAMTPSPAAGDSRPQEQAPPSPPPGRDPRALVTEIAATTQGQARVATSASSERVSFAGAPTDHPLATGDPSDKSGSARAFIDHFSPMFGVGDPAELQPRGVVDAADGGLTVRYAQRRNGTPVIGGDIAVRVDARGDVVATTGHALASDRQTATRPAIGADAATRQALDETVAVRASDPAHLRPSTPELRIWDPTIFDPRSTAPAVLVWQVHVRDERGDVDELVLIDAQTGAVTLHADQVEHAQRRRVCNASLPDDACEHPVRLEGGPPTGDAQLDNLYDDAGDTYDFYLSRFGRDGIDGAGMTTVLIGHDVEANAHWDPFSEVTVFGEGYAIDDVVGHEITHGVTHFTSDLAYFGQSGAMNESMSDVFGELIDLTNGRGDDSPGVRWQAGEELPTSAIRSMSDPPSHGQPDRMRSPLYDDPGNVFDPHGGSGVGNKTAFLITDGGSFNGQSITGIGIDKAALIYWETQAHLLASGSNYADLGNGLQQACLQLTGSHGITASDCDQVRKATIATELNLPPSNPDVGRPAAPVCPAGQFAHDLFDDDMENPLSGRWDLGNTGLRPSWGYEAGLATSGNRALTSGDPGIVSRLDLTQVQGVSLPAGKPTFLRFNHAMGAYEDGTIVNGGVVEYRLDGSGDWHDAGPLMTTNGYDKTLVVYPPIGINGRAGFGGSSNGYVSTRADFSSLAGHSVQIRFQYGVTSHGQNPGWTLDDVRLFNCEATASVPGAPTNLAAVPGSSQAVVSWDPPVSDGGQPVSGYTVVASPGGATANVGVARSAVVSGLTDGTPYTFTVRAENSVGSGALSAASSEVTPTGQGGSLFHPLPPARLLDSRDGTGGFSTRWSGGQTRDLTVVGVGGVPATNVSAVVLNMTVTDASAASHLTVFPAGAPMPTVSNVNFQAGQTVADHVTVKVGAGGRVSIYNNAGNVSVIADVVGYDDAGTGGGAAFTGIQPFRLVDTRDGTGGFSWPWFPAQDEAVTVTGTGGPGGVPADATAVVMNLTAVNGTSASHLTAYPDGQSAPTASNLNFPALRVVPNLVTVKVGDNGRIRIRNQAGFVHLLVDIVGYYAVRPTGGRFVALTPSRIVDSRAPLGLQPRRYFPQESRDIVVAGEGGVPTGGAASVVLNVTGIGAQHDTHIVCWPSGVTHPNVSNLNLVPGQTATNQVIVKLGANGQIRCYDNFGESDLVVDVVGYVT